ncbi:MAG: hypothetical protein P8Z40_01850 [Chloroflexota bacterium]
MNQRRLPIAQLILVLICVPVFLALAIPSAWLLAFAQSWRGRGLAGLGLALAIFPSALLIGWIAAQKGRAAARFWHRFAVGLGVAILALGLALLLTTPTGYPRADSPVSHQFVGERRFPRFTPTNLIPEVEQVNAGFWAAALLDPYIDWAQKREVSAYTFDLYREMERDPDFRALGSAMGWAYTDLQGFPPDVGHYYLYVPENRPPGPLPAIVYLHGAAGNFKSYTWAWSRLAEEQGYVIIAPSFGFGDWRQPGGVDAVLNALDDAEQIVALDPARIYLAGLSNGGYGVSGPRTLPRPDFPLPRYANRDYRQPRFPQQVGQPPGSGHGGRAGSPYFSCLCRPAGGAPGVGRCRRDLYHLSRRRSLSFLRRA